VGHPAADKQEQREQDEHDRAFCPDVHGVADEQPSDQRRPPLDVPAPQQHQRGEHQQEGEQRLGHDQVLVFDHVPVEEHGQGRGGGPELGDVVAAEQHIDHDRDRQPHQVLQHDDQGQAVERQQGPQEERVAGRLGQVRLRPQRGAQVHVGVPREPQHARIAEHRY
jgi:hypothetical protein